MNGSKYDVAWFKKYEELRDFKRREGHCNVPQHSSENKSLALWVCTQRKQYKKMREGKICFITEPRIQYLKEIGFQWTLNDPYDVAWFKKYEELKQFKCREGHCNVPQRVDENKSLRLWIHTQRTQYRKMREGKPSSMTESRIKFLEEIDFQWSLNGPYKDVWFKRYEELKQFKCHEGHCNVPRNFNENKSLGQWVSTQRFLYKKMREGKSSSMTKSRIRALEDIGFFWGAYKKTIAPEVLSMSPMN